MVKKFKKYAYTFIGDIRQSFLDLTIIVAVVAFFQFIVIREVPEAWPSMLWGLAIVGVGLALFLRGLEIGIFPLGEELAELLSSSGSKLVIVFFGFVVGFATTIAEPSLIAVADKAASISNGGIDALVVRLVVAFAVGFAIVLGVLRLFFNHPIHYYIIAGYVLATGLSFFAPPEIVGLAFDSGGVTTSTVTVPLVAALGIGLARSLKNRNPVIDGFGLIAFASVTPMIFVQLYGIAAYQFGFNSIPFVEQSFLAPLSFDTTLIASAFTALSFGDLFDGLLKTIGDVLPILVVIGFFYYAVLRKSITNIPERAFGFGLVVLGLYAFVFGLEIGLFPIGESLARSLVENGVLWVIYVFAFLIGFATTMAEPALSAIARKAEEVSGGAIQQFLLRVFVAFGAGFGIFLGAYRIVNGDPIIYYLLAGYLLVIVLTLFAPRSIIPIAFDSGGVTTSTITVPVIAAIGIGLASTVPERDALIDGFGMIALTVLFPIVSVLGYGIFEAHNIKRHERRIARLTTKTADRVLRRLQGERVLGEQKAHAEIITITGAPGAGVSSVAQCIAKKLRYHYFSSGEIFRIVADRHGVTVEELNTIAENDQHIDEEIDQIVRDLGVTESKLIVDSRLAYHWISNSFKVYLSVNPTVGAERLYSADLELHGTCTHTPEEVLRRCSERMESKRRRYQKLYGIDITNTTPFNVVIDTTEMSANDAAHAIMGAYRGWLGK